MFSETYSPLIVIMIVFRGQSFFMSFFPTGGCNPSAVCSEIGWFGPSCQFQCHCKFNICQSDGSCENNDSCTYGYFGPACQWVDIAILYGADTNNKFLVDDDGTTCNPNETSFVDVYVKPPMPFSFFRIHVIRDSAFITDFLVILNNGNLCNGLHRFVYSPSVVDVICDTDLRLSSLRIHGRIAPHICSVQIAGGRNLALRQTANMSSIWNEYNLSLSEHAVDGSRDGDFNNGHCVHSDHELRPTLLVQLSEPSRVYRVALYNRDPASTIGLRLSGFILETYDEDNNRVEKRVDQSRLGHPVYHVLLVNTTLISAISVSIEGKTGLPVLTICELEAYGDIKCSSDTYGLQCQTPCSCEKSQLCNPFVGTCTGGCRAGYYSPDCTLPCSRTCSHRLCDFVSGYCYHCVPGYQGKYCETVCTPGTWAQDCAENCSKFCNAPCNPVTGFCECQENFVGDSCQDCIRGRFGEDCSSGCPKFCGINPCDRETGECLRCTGGRIGPTCEECEETYHGPMCNFRCSKSCINRSCEIHFGRCFGCEPGFKGDFCDMAISQTSLMFYAVPLLVVILTALCCYCLLAATESTGQEE